MDAYQIKSLSNQLADKDPIMAYLITKYGPCTLEPHTRHWEELTSSIISQQLSVKAARTIWLRFLKLFHDSMPTPLEIINTEDSKLRGAGLSHRKIAYIKDLAIHILDGRLEIDSLSSLPNHAIITELTDVKGIGIWSAHMFMIFSLARPDILAWGDLGVRKSAMKLYGLEAIPDQKILEALSRENGWSGAESIACWYLWKALDNNPS